MNVPLRRRFVWRRLPALIALAAGVWCAAAETVHAQQKSVLVVYATRRDAQIVAIGDRELPRVLGAGMGDSVDYYSEVLDLTRFDQSDYETAFTEYLTLRYGGRRFDLVIAMGSVPMRFITRHRSTVFADSPLVFFSDRPAARPANSTGLVAHMDLRSTVDLAVALQPETRNIFVVVGTGTPSLSSAADEQLRPLQSNFAVHFLRGLRTADLEARLATLPANSIVYYLAVDRDGDGQLFHPLIYLSRVVAAANAPVYSWVDSAMDRGIVGGSLKDQVRQMDVVGNLALRVLNGEAPDRIPPLTMDLNVPQLDWRQLQRWGISESRVPAGTLVRFRELSVWARYSDYIIAAVFLLLAQSGLIAGLLIQRSRRQRAEAQILRNQRELRRSYERIRDLASRLLGAQEDERSRIARDLHDDISQQMALLKIDLEQLGAVVEGEAESLTFEAQQRAQNIARSVHDLSHRLHPAKLRLIGLVSALQGLRRELSHTDINITFEHENVPTVLREELALCLFRIVQEALQNAIKYSKGRHVAVHLKGSANELTLTIADDGVGFDVSTAGQQGIGLISMHERLDAVGGSLIIQSKPGEGTRLLATVPLRFEPDFLAVGA
jgi:signal transduction histidine kinase